MLLLAVDTSGSYGSIALAQCGADGSCEALEVTALEGGTFSAQLIPQIAALLERQGFSKDEIDGYAVASGPGSFTGLRVGLAGIKGLAEVTLKPIAAVSVLEAVASVASSSSTITVVLDAGRRELYVGDYENGVAVSLERVVGQEEFLPKGIVFTPDPKIADFLRTKEIVTEQVQRPRSDEIARLGWRKILAGEVVTAESLDANYVRRTDAEILIKP